jgi:hypothetical protein
MVGSPVVPDWLRALTRRYPRWAWPVTSPQPLGNAGGRSGAVLWKWGAESGELLLRGWPLGVASTRVRAIHAWLGALGHCSFVPRPIAGDRGETWQELDGRVWQLEPWMKGVTRPAAEWDLPHVVVAFRALRQVHDGLGESGPVSSSPAVRQRLAEIRGLLGGGIEQLRAAVGEAPGPEAETARDWLRAAPARLMAAEARLAPLERFPVRLRPCLRDCRVEHFLFEGERLGGLVDYGAMDLDTPWVDLARLFVDLDDRLQRQLALEAYGRADAGLQLLEPLRLAAEVLIGAHWIRWAFVERRRFETGAVLAGLRYGRERLLSALG